MRTLLVFPAALLLLSACTVSSHATQRSTLGVKSSSAELLAAIAGPGPVTVETVAGCDWEVDRGGLINLKNKTAREAGLVEGPEPIQIYFHVLRHPTRGVFIIDTGVENALRDAPEKAAMRGTLASYMHFEKMKFLTTLGDWLKAHPEPLSGVFITHLHADHLTGMADVPAGTAVYTGPGEAGERAMRNMFVQGSSDRALLGKAPISEWAFEPDASKRFEGVIDVFGDRSVYAIWVPGHTPGSTAYLVRTPSGPVLFTGDASHTRWGWDHDVEPGTFSGDIEQSAESFRKLRALVKEVPAIDVRLGHQR